MQAAGDHLSGVATEIQVRPNRQLHRETQRAVAPRGLHLHRLQVFQQARPLVPRRARAASGHVIAIARAHRDEERRFHLQFRRHRAEFVADALEHVLPEIHQVHLVHRHRQLAYAQQRGDISMAARLLQHAMTGIQQNHRQTGRGCSGGHVARVLLVARRVGDDELAARRLEIAVGHVDGNGLLPLGPQPVGDQRQVEPFGVAVPTGFAHRFELVFVNPARIVEQAADERRFAIVHAAGGGEAQQVFHQKYPSRFLSSMEPSWSWSITRFSRSDRRKPRSSSMILGSVSASERMAPVQ